jgi:glucosamine-6-phosphate deaminase
MDEGGHTHAVRTPGVLVASEPRRVGLVAAELLVNRLHARPALRALLPTGHTPRGMYAALRAHAARGFVPAARATVFQLDEYAGLGRDDPVSFRATLERELAGVAVGRLEEVDGAAADLDAEAARYQALLDERPIDLAVLGIGRDAHVAFNEPGSGPDDDVRRVPLAGSTIDAAAESFGGRSLVPREALTVGLRTLRAAREVLVLATGEAKAEAVREMLEGPAGPGAPASLLRDHPALLVVCDEAAASRLTPAPNRASDRVVVVLGHREPGVSREHRISGHSRARLFRAEEACLTVPVRAAILTGATTTGGLSEAEQLAREWTVADVPNLLDVAGRTTAENASRSLPLILAIGGIRTALIVTSPWHLRARMMFSRYDDFGLDADLRLARPLRHWRHLLHRELAGLPRAWSQRREAMADVHAIPPEDAEP